MVDFSKHAAGRWFNADTFRQLVLEPRNLRPEDGIELTVRLAREEDVPDPARRGENVAQPVLYFEGVRVGVVATRPILRAMADIVGTYESDAWRGWTVNVYLEPEAGKVQRGGRRGPAIRVRQAQADRGFLVDPLPDTQREKVRRGLVDCGLTFDGFVEWLGERAAYAQGPVKAAGLDRFPAGALPLVRRYALENGRKRNVGQDAAPADRSMPEVMLGGDA